MKFSVIRRIVNYYIKEEAQRIDMNDFKPYEFYVFKEFEFNNNESIEILLKKMNFTLSTKKSAVNLHHILFNYGKFCFDRYALLQEWFSKQQNLSIPMPTRGSIPGFFILLCLQYHLNICQKYTGQRKCFSIVATFLVSVFCFFTCVCSRSKGYSRRSRSTLELASGYSNTSHWFSFDQCILWRRPFEYCHYL
jgi:hypothetical protein